jgi:hypothetical protein
MPRPALRSTHATFGDGTGAARRSHAKPTVARMVRRNEASISRP